MKRLLLLLFIAALLGAASLLYSAPWPGNGPPVGGFSPLSSNFITGAKSMWFGPEAINRAGEVKNNTVVDKESTAPFTGKITSIKIYTTGGDIESVEFACFVDEGSNVFATDASGKTVQDSGAVTLSAGLNTLAAGTDFNEFDCKKGEYPGVYIPNDADGGMDVATSGGSGYNYVSQDEVPSAGETMVPAAGYTASLQFYIETGTATAQANYLLTEAGEYLTDEDGNKLTWE